ncbi:MAG TPA: 16S rRNA (cytosine(967)-C(5))-methyltransferase RsmB [Vicinamibacterales bacterium]|nr:16S rRNA (cytosine(967)-C(5))-methyltransferase RsmB [Vicinamibacterales bacterium]
MIAPARLAAYQILCAVSTGSADLPSAIASARSGLADERDRALAAEIAAGVQRWRSTLDHLVVTFSKRAITRLDPEVLEILRLSIYQLLHLTRVPAAAVVDDAVDLTKRAGKRSASGFVNAILRSVSRRRNSLPLPARPSDAGDRAAALEYLSVSLSHPRWLAERWYERLGLDAAESWMRFNNTPGSVTLRANRLRTTRDELIGRLAADEILVHPTDYAPDGLVVDEGHPLRGPLRDEGAFVVQDEASQLVPLLAGDEALARVLDTCASPGGKTTALAALMNGGGLLVACDVRERRIELLRRTVAASGAANIRIVQADFLQSAPFTSAFQCVLVDAPCSGLGTLRRDPDIRWRRHEQDLSPLAAAELTMLQRAAACVAPGGRLVYATCSSEPEENEGVVDAFLATTSGFAPLHAAQATARLDPRLVDPRGHLRTQPHLHRLEAFFGAVFERQA